MKVLLIATPIENMISTILPEDVEKNRGYSPPLGLMYIASYLRDKGYKEISIIDAQAEELSYEVLKDRIKAFKPDFVGITTMSFTIIDVLKTVRISKELFPGVKVVLGGPHVHIYPEVTLRNCPDIDFIIMGEGEKPFAELIEAFGKKKSFSGIKGLVYRSGSSDILNNGPVEFIEDLDSVPFPARDLVKKELYSSVLSHKNIVTTMITSRGCPFQCTFCDRPHLGKKFRARSAKNVVDEMQQCYEMGIEDFFIYDDTFNLDKQRVIDICNEIMKRSLKIGWDIRGRVDRIDENSLRLMKKAGCERIHFGVESGSERILKKIKKGITLKQVQEAFNISRSIGITTLGYFMLGFPDETEDEMFQTIRFATKLPSDFVQFAILIPFPATNMYRELLNCGYYQTDIWFEFANNPSVNFSPPVCSSKVTEQRLLEIWRYAYRRYYRRPSYILRSLKKIKSFKELRQKMKVGLKILKF